MTSNNTFTIMWKPLGGSYEHAVLLYAKRDDENLIDFAVLKIQDNLVLSILPISLIQFPYGKVKISGYGTNFNIFSSAQGIIESRSVAEKNIYYFKIDSKNAGQHGYSGGVVYSLEANAVIGIQIESSTFNLGTDRDVVFAMPMSRIVEAFPPLYNLIIQENKIEYSNSDIEQKVLEKHFNATAEKVKNLYINPSASSNSHQDIRDIFISIPTDVKLDIKVKNRQIVDLYDSISPKKTKYIFYSLIINYLQNNLYSYNDWRYKKIEDKPLIFKPAWKDGIYKEFEVLRAIDIISTSQFCIAIGGPGSGKSTLLKYLTIKLIDQYFASRNVFEKDSISELFFKTKYIPVYIDLKEFYRDLSLNNNLHSISEVVIFEYLAKCINLERKNLDTFKFLLKNRLIIFLMDGIDEILNNDYSANDIKNLIEVIKEINKNAKIVLTSRRNGYETWSLESFLEFNLLNLDKYSKNILIYKLLSALGSKNLEDDIINLQKAIEINNLEDDIIGNPLFLSLIIIIFFRKKKLPSYKSSILEESIKILIERWREKILLIDKSGSSYEINDLFICLKNLAYETLFGKYKNNSNPLIFSSLIINGIISKFISQEKNIEVIKCL